MPLMVSSLEVHVDLVYLVSSRLQQNSLLPHEAPRRPLYNLLLLPRLESIYSYQYYRQLLYRDNL